jgi:hypothetical protein
MNGIISAHIPLLNTIMWVKALRLRWKLRVDILGVWALHDGEMSSKNVTTHSFVAFLISL